MEQEIQTCRFNSAWKEVGGGVRESGGVAIHPFIKKGILLFFFSFSHISSLNLSHFFFFFLSFEIRFSSQRSAGLCLRLHMLSSDVETRSRA